MRAGQTVYSEAVRERTETLAQLAGEAAWKEVTPRLDDLGDLFGPNLMEQIMRRVQENAGDELKGRRENVSWNDHHSSEAGMVLFLNPWGMAKLRDNVRRGFSSYRYLEEFQAVGEDGKLSALHLPHGGYWQDNGGVDIFEHYPQDMAHNYAHGAAIYRGGIKDIVRIEASGGELVQNRYFAPDGTPNFTGARPPGFMF